ncbi:hypothetical protein M9Y10_045177 [Tritrichomonas musculus]|uniref:non-specific serine/threonine protein kinase n=1 Tax=Tritrichomonas musculus TaxID=1915356 RepID=A0ABR2JUP7_9EUKA
MTEKKQPPEFKKGFVLSHYRFERMIGQGGYGFIFVVHDIEDDKPYAMKVEKIVPNKQGLKPEIKFVPQIQGSPYFPQCYDSGENELYRWIVYEILGSSLSFARWQMPHDKFSKYTALRSGIHMLKALEESHNRGIIHRDVKPGNFLLRPNHQYPIVLIDFGLSRRFKKPTGEIIPPREKIGFVGTSRYASCSVYEGHEQSRGDDLISWFYSLIEILKGDLPFPQTKDKKKLLIIKRNLKPEKLCKGLPSQLVDIWNLLQGIGYYDEPNYKRIYELIDEAISTLSHKDPEYDWNKLSKKKVKQISAIDFRDDEAENESVHVFETDKDISQGPPVCNIF